MVLYDFDRSICHSVGSGGDVKMENKQKVTFISAILIIIIFFTGLNLFGDPPYVYDNAALFSVSELEALEKKAADLTEKLPIDFVILTISDNQYKTVEDYAQDFYSQNGLGHEVTKVAILMLFDMDSEQLYISPFSNDGTNPSFEKIKFTYDEIIAKFGSDDFYYTAATTYLDTIEDFINENDIKVVTNTVSEKDTAKLNVSFYLFVSMMFACLIILSIVPRMDHTYTNEIKIRIDVGNYLENNALNIVDKQDRHINTQMAARR